jgi:hypothetical protein
VAYTLLDAGLLAADPEGAKEQWCIFYGGPDPDNCAGSRLVDEEVDAEEEIQFMIDAGIACRTVTYGPWRIVPTVTEDREGMS